MNRKYLVVGVLLVGALAGAVVGYKLLIAPENGLGGRTVAVAPNRQNAAPASQTIEIGTPIQEFSADEEPAQTYQSGEKVTITTPEKLPEPDKFKSFAYDQTAGKIISVSGSCSDAYYAIVIFRAADDYKKNPAASVFNRAFECPTDRKFSGSIELKDFNLPSGEYYFIVADQGNTGGWYNPR